MKTQLKATRSRLFAFAAAAWMLFGTLLLVLMTMWNGWPFPAAVPQQPFALAGFVLTIAFVYVLPVWLLHPPQVLMPEVPQPLRARIWRATAH